MKCGVQLSHVLLFLKKMLLVKENHQIHMCTQIEHNIFGIKNRNFPKLVRKHKNRLFFFFFSCCNNTSTWYHYHATDAWTKNHPFWWLVFVLNFPSFFVSMREQLGFTLGSNHVQYNFFVGKFYGSLLFISR